LAAVGVSADLLAQLGSELDIVSKRRNALECRGPELANSKLVKAWNYAEEGVIEVGISRLSGDTDVFEVYQWTSVRDLKDMIEARMDIPAGQQVLLKGGQELGGDRDCLAAYRVTPNKSQLQVLQVENRGSGGADGGLEIRLTSAKGIPEGSIISIRAGESRRQAPLRIGDPFKFPKTRETANPFKIDVFSQLGKARLVLRPDVERYVAEISSSDGADDTLATVEFEAVDNHSKGRHQEQQRASPNVAAVSSNASTCPRPDATVHPASVRARVQKTVLASRYLDEHGLYQYMQNLIQSLIVERPANPYQYMIRQLQIVDRAHQKADEAGTQKLEEVGAQNIVDVAPERPENVVAPLAEKAGPEKPTEMALESTEVARCEKLEDQHQE